MKALRIGAVWAALWIGGAATAAKAQGCSVCTKTAADLNEKSARGLNGGIIYLAAIPLVALGTIGTIWWRRSGAER